MSGVSAAHPRGHASSPNSSGTPNPKAHRRQGRRSCIRQDKRIHARHTPSTRPKPKGTANPNAHRRHSRRSCTRQDKRTCARRRPCTQPKPKGHSQPKRVPAAKPPQPHQTGQAHLRGTKGLNDRIRQDNSAHARLRAQTTRTRQRRAAQAAQTAVGDAQLRILLRDDHVQSLRRRKVPTHQQKRFSLWGTGDISFWQAQKEMPPKFPAALKKAAPSPKKASPNPKGVSKWIP